MKTFAKKLAIGVAQTVTIMVTTFVVLSVVDSVFEKIRESTGTEA